MEPTRWVERTNDTEGGMATFMACRVFVWGGEVGRGGGGVVGFGGVWQSLVVISDNVWEGLSTRFSWGDSGISSLCLSSFASPTSSPSSSLDSSDYSLSLSSSSSYNFFSNASSCSSIDGYYA